MWLDDALVHSMAICHALLKEGVLIRSRRRKGWVRLVRFGLTLCSALKVFQSSSNCSAADSQDGIYSILSLLELEHKNMLLALDERIDDSDDKMLELNLDVEMLKKRLKIQPDYSFSAAEVFTQISKGLMNH